MRTRGCLRMILNGENRAVFQPDAFNGIIIEVYMGYFHFGVLPDGDRIHAKSMILRSDLAFAGNQVFYRVIQPPVAMVHFKGGDTLGQGQQLVSEANSEQAAYSSLRISFTVSTA